MMPEQAKLFFNTLLQSLPDVFVLCFDKDLRYIEVQGGGLEAGGVSRESILGHTLWEAMPPPVVQAVEPAYRAVFAGERSQINLPYDGGVYEVSIVPVRDDAGEVLAGIAIVRNTTQHRQVTLQARRFEAIVENAVDTMMVFDMEGKIQYANPAAAKLYRLENPADLVGRPGVWSLAPEEMEETIGTMMADLESKGVWRGQVWNQLPDGTRFLAEAVAFMLFDEQGNATGSATITRDITERVREEEQRAEFQQQIIAGQEATLRELSTPLIPLADNVVVMPIIGTIDSQRAQQIMETLLEGIAANQADVALLDISGVRVVDTQVADALLRVAQAAKLLGTQIVLTGIRAEVAQTIVHLGADMSGIVTRSNLQDGLRYALTIADANLVPASAFSRKS